MYGDINASRQIALGKVVEVLGVVFNGPSSESNPRKPGDLIAVG
jgi:hypothetical protein